MSSPHLPRPACVRELCESERRRELINALEVIAGDRCPCGHLASEHRRSRSSGGLPAGLTLMFGACRLCQCRGLVEPDELGEP